MERDPEILVYINQIYRDKIKLLSEYCEIVCNNNTINEDDVINAIEFIKGRSP